MSESNIKQLKYVISKHYVFYSYKHKTNNKKHILVVKMCFLYFLFLEYKSVLKNSFKQAHGFLGFHLALENDFLIL